MRAVSKSAVGSILDAVASRVSLIDTCAGLVVTKMVPPLSVSSCPVEVGTSVCVWGEGGRRGERETTERGERVHVYDSMCA